MRKTIDIIAKIFSVLYVAVWILEIILIAQGLTDVITYIVTLVSCTIEIILIWGLDVALKKIEILESILEKKKIIKQKDIDEETDGYSVEEPKKIRYCPNCNYQLFPDDRVCPNCGCKINSKKKVVNEGTDEYGVEEPKNIHYCPNCNYQLFPEDIVCPNCGYKINNQKKD
jgi:uncharacterized OB-fold protein